MKKITLILILLFLFTATSCNYINLPENETANTEQGTASIAEQGATANTENNTDSDTLLQEIPPESVDVPMLTFSTIEEYDIYFGKMEILPKGFIPYDAIKEIGEFDGLVILCEYDSGLYNKGLYSLIDKNGEKIGLYFDSFSNDNTVSTENIIFSHSSDDLRFLESEQSGVLIQDELKYTYISGKLLSLEWVAEGTKFTLVGDSMLSDYGDYDTQDNPTFLQRIIDPQTSFSTVCNFNSILIQYISSSDIK